MIRIAALLCGVLCGLGLALSGLQDPTVLQGFLGARGGWDPSIGLVAVSALLVSGAVSLATRTLSRGRPGSILGGEIERVEGASCGKAVAGGALFGVGLGLAGYAPLSALVALGVFAPGAAVFLSAALGGMILHDLVVHRGRLERISG